MRLSAQTKLGHYEVLGPIGAGGMGEVYRARDLQLDRDVAIKVLPESLSESEAARERFEREAKLIATLSHANILTIFEFGAEGDLRYAVTELLEGETLRDHLRRRKTLEPAEALEIGVFLANGLAAAHKRGIIHRDIKPANIFISSDGTVKILDFGLARSHPVGMLSDSSDYFSRETVIRDGPVPMVTESGAVLGTVGYMSPEQARGQVATEACDVFSLGCVMYEMLTGRGPFHRDTPSDSIAAILNMEPEPMGLPPSTTARGLDRIIRKALTKEASGRQATGTELHEELADLQKEITAAQTRPFYRQPRLLVGFAAVIAIFGLVFWQSQSRQARERWAREEVLPEIMEKIDAEDYRTAFALAQEIEPIIPNDPVLGAQWERMSEPMSFHTEPAGAMISYAPYNPLDAPWTPIGETPLDEVRLPWGPYRWKVEKSGYDDIMFGAVVPRFYYGKFVNVNPEGESFFSFELAKRGTVPEGMIALAGGQFATPLTGFSFTTAVEIPEFVIGRNEVTNAEFKEFVHAGGYTRPEFWKHEFLEDGTKIGWTEAIALFIDNTDRPGPATWELGDYPEGQADFPVGGISWFEAAAYAEFRGMSLPTIYHWARAALASSEIEEPLAPSIVLHSNFSGEGPTPAGETGVISRSGALDMAGNVREWCHNASGDRRYILGGGWDDQAYMFSQTAEQSPWNRFASNGMRLADFGGPPSEGLLASIDFPPADYRAEANSVSDEVFEVIVRNLGYADSPLAAKIESRRVLPGLGTNEIVTIETAYGPERMTLHIWLPEGAEPPYQTLVMFGGASVLILRRFEEDGIPKHLEYFRKSGRAMVWPIYYSTYERNQGRAQLDLNAGGQALVNVITRWSKDLGRTIDYLEERPDIDTDRLAYYGLSLGPVIGSIILTAEPRIRTAIFESGGMTKITSVEPLAVPQAAFVKRLTLPILMANGRYDYVFPYESEQLPFFEILGTPAEHKKHLVFDAGHSPLPRTEIIREYTAWLDKYLGEVRWSGRARVVESE